MASKEKLNSTVGAADKIKEVAKENLETFLIPLMLTSIALLSSEHKEAQLVAGQNGRAVRGFAPDGQFD